MAQPLPRTWRALQDAQKRSRAADRRMRHHVRNRSARAETLGPVESASAAGLHYVNADSAPGIRRVGSAKRFRYLAPGGRAIADRTELERIRSLAIPPAWRDVWICTDPRGHLQVTGRDARGRKQYRYHPKWRDVRDEVKYGRLIAFAGTLPLIRRRTAGDLRRPGLTRERVLAAVVQLLEKTLIRVGNDEYARANRSFGLTTMRNSHATITGGSLHFEFRGKSGIEHAVDLRDRRLARIVKACRDLPGHELFQYVGDDGRRHSIGSADVNAYLREITGHDFTAKDFRTWAGTVLAAKALAAVERATSTTHAKREVIRAIESVAKSLGNTRTVCRKSYIHPAVLDGYMDGVTIDTVRCRASRLLKRGRLEEAEAAVVTLISGQLRRNAA